MFARNHSEVRKLAFGPVAMLDEERWLSGKKRGAQKHLQAKYMFDVLRDVLLQLVLLDLTVPQCPADP